jgi:hypothetical protein
MVDATVRAAGESDADVIIGIAGDQLCKLSARGHGATRFARTLKAAMLSSVSASTIDERPVGTRVRTGPTEV